MLDPFQSEQFLPSQSDLRPTWLTNALNVKIHESFDKTFKRKTMSYLHQSVSTEVPWTELRKGERASEKCKLLDFVHKQN